MAKKKLTVKELEETRKGINKDEEDEKKAKAQGVKTSAPVYTYKDTNVTASDVAKKFNVQLPNKNASTGSNNAPGANAKAQATSAAYTNKVTDMFEKSKLYAAQGPDHVIDLANSIISGAATKPDKGNLGALDIDSIHDMTKISSDVARMLTDAGIFNIREIATNPLYAHLAQQEYRKSLLPTLQGELTNSQQADEANNAAQAEYEATLRGMNAEYSKQAEKAAQWKNFFSLLGENPTLEDKLRAAGIATGQTYDMGVFRGMDKYTAYEKKQALDNWFAGLDAAALSAAPVVEEPEAPKYTSKTAGIQDEIGTLEKYINAHQTLEELTAYARSNPNFAEDSVYTAPDYSGLSAWDKFLMPQMGGGYADNALYTYINTGEVDPYFSQDPGSADYYKRWEELGYDYALDQDKAIWNVLRKMDPAKADAYLQALSLIHLLPTRAQGYRSWDETVATNPWTAAPAWAGSVLQGVGNILDVPQQFAEAWAGVDNPYSAAFDNLNRQGNTRGAQLGEIRESDMPDWLKTASEYAYKGVSGFADNTARLLASGMNPTASLIMAGLQASSHSLHESAGRDDVSSAAKIIKAIGAGAIEVGTEKIGLDALFDMGKTGAKKYLSVVLSELGEETANKLSEPALESVVAFLFDHEADIKRGPEFWEEMTDTALTTLVSASLMGGSAVTSDYLDTRSYGKGIVNNGDADTILQIGQGMPENSESKRISDEITGKQGKGKKPSFYQFGQLTKAIVKDLGEERAAIVNRVQDEAIVERLVELGEDRAAAKQNASIIRRIARGEKVPRKEAFEAKWSDNATQVVKELTRETKPEDVNRAGNKWVADMEAQQLSETSEVKGKQLQVQVATVTPIGKAANRAEEAAKKRVPKRDGKPKLATDSHVTFRASDGNAEISGEFMRFEETEEGMQVVVQTGKGKEGEQKAKLEDWISADGDGVATLLSYIGDDKLPHSVTAEEANTLMQVYKHSGGNAKAVIQAFDVNYLAGYSGDNQVGSVLDPGLANVAYEAGKAEAEKDEARRFEMAKGRTRNENVSIGWIGEVDSDSQITGRGDPDALATAMESMTEEQRNAVNFISELCREFGANAVLYASKPGSNVSQSGRYDYDAHSDTFFFDINAGATTDLAYARQIKNGTLGAALPKFVGHEFTHFMQINSAEGYANYAKAVKNALNERGQDVAVLMRNRIDQALANGRKLTMQEAEFEVIAHASEYMLQDSKFTDSMDDSLKGRFRQFIKEFGQKIRNAFAKLTGGTVESRALREQIDGVYHYVNDLQKLWDIGMTEAGNRPTQGTTTTSDDVEVSKEVTTYKSDAMSIVEDLENPDGSSLFSLRSMQEDYDTYRQMLADNGVSAEEIDALFETIDETMRIVESEREILDFGWNVGRDQRSFNPVKQNSDPLYKVSLDFSSLCRKRLLQQTVQERLEAKYDTVLTKAERVAIRNELMLLREEGKQIEVACALCYVESARLKSPAQIQRFFDDRRAVMVDYFAKKNKEYMQGVNAKAGELIVKFGNKPGTKKGELNSFQKKAVENLKQSMYKTYTPSAEEETIIRTALDLPGESFRSADGLWKLKKEHEEIFDAYASFVRNATKSKGIEGDEAWWAGDSQNISDKLIAKMNAENGLRSQSWSDFQVIHLLDYMAAVIELSTRNAKMQTYTKVPDFVKLMGDTGAMINLSLIPKGFDGTLNYDPIEGMPIEDALALRRDFPNTAGTICIGITDKHIRMLLANDDIDYVIPYHASSLDKKTRQQMGMKVWEDFTNYQNEKQRDYSNTVKDTKTYHKKPSFSEWFDYDTVAARAREVGANMAMQEAAERYIDLCHRRGLQEKFAQFANEPNYWKLLIDRKMINQVTGEIIQQKAVQPRFDLDRIKGILQGEVDRFKAQNQDFNEAISHIEQKWENGEIRKAAKSKKVQDAVKAFEDTVIVRNIIESAAEMDQPKSLYAPREADELTTRDYLAESDDSIAETVEERNALTIYQKLLKDHAAASEAVMAAEQALETAPESQKTEARKTLSAARAKQRDLYNRLLNVERTAHVQSVISRANQFMTEELHGKTREAVEKAIADRETKIAELKADLTGLKGAAKTQREADIRQHERIVARFKSKAAQMVLENSEKYEQRIRDLRDRRDLNIEIDKKARHIKRVVKALNNRIVHEDDYKNVKEPLKPAVHTLVRTFLDGFGNLVFDQKAADKLKSVYDVLAQDDATVEYYDDEVSDWLTTLAKLSRQDEELRAGGSTLESLNDKLYIYTTLSDIADHVAHMVTAADTMFMEGRKASVSGVTEDIGNTLLAKEDRRELAGALGKAANFVDNLIIRGNMMPQFFFEGLNNKGMMQLYDGLQDGVRMYSERLLTGENFLEDAMRRYGYHTWRDMDKVVEFKTQQGHTIHLKRENMMWIYATAKREASNPLMDTHHLDEGGFVYEESSAPTKGLFKAKNHQQHHKIVQEDVEAITAMLTAEQIAFMDECVEFLSTECADWGNEASMQLFGIKKYKEKYYFPFKVDGGQLYKNSAAGSTSTTSDARVKHISFSHSIKKGANTPLVMGEFTSVIADHINQMATYSGLVVPIENMNRVLNRKVDDDGDMVTIRSLLGRKYGSPSSKYVDDLLKDLNGGPQTDNRGTWDAGIRLFKKNAVVGKMSVAIQQPTAITRAFAYINPRWFVNLHMERPKETWERMMKYSGTAVLKDMGGFNVGLGKGAKNWIERGDLGDYNVFKRSKFLLDQKGFKAAKDEWVDFLTGLPGWMDKVTWISIWNAAENEQAHQHPGMDRNSDEFLQMVGRRFDDIINHTQVYDSILSKSQNMRSKNTLAKMATSFMAESTLNMNLAYRAFASRDVKQIGKVVSSLLLNAALGAAAYALVGSWNKDDDDRTWEEKYAVAFAGRLADNLNPMASIPYLSDIWNKIQGYDVERTDLSYVLDLAEDGMKFFDKMFNPDEALSYRDYENFVGGMFAAATGIPAKNWMGDARRIWNMTHTKTEDAPSSRVWYGILDEILPGKGTNNTAYYERLLAATMDGDKQEMYDLKDYLTATKGVKESSITSGVRDAYKKVYMRGGISKNDAVSFLLANGLATGKTEAERKQSAFEYVDKWEEGIEGYSAYNTLRKAFSDGNSASIQKAWDELEANGWSNDSIGSYVRNTIIKGMVTSGRISPSKATELIRKWYPYKKDKDNIDKPKEWLNSK